MILSTNMCGSIYIWSRFYNQANKIKVQIIVQAHIGVTLPRGVLVQIWNFAFSKYFKM